MVLGVVSLIHPLESPLPTFHLMVWEAIDSHFLENKNRISLDT